MLKLVKQILEAQKKLREAISAPEKEQIEKRIAILDDQIDRAVYELYELTEKEIAIVESET